MRILVLSDSHGSFDSIYNIAQLEKPDLIIHLGDGVREAEDLGFATETEVLIVRGNMDFYSDYPAELVVELEGERLFLCHGHTYGVKRSFDSAIAAARNNNCGLLLFGHTHVQLLRQEPGLIIMNPGSSGYMGKYAVVELGRGGAVCHLRDYR